MESERLWRTSFEDLREESVHCNCKPWTDSITISPGKLRPLSNPGRGEKFRTAKQELSPWTKPQERKACLNTACLSGCQEGEQKKDICRGRRRGASSP